MFKRLVLSAALLAASAGLAAQTRPAAAPAAPAAQPQLTAEQQAQLKVQNQKMAQAAAQVVSLIDQGKAGEVWDGASQIAKRAIARDAFVTRTTQARKAAGKLVKRELAAVTRTASDGNTTPVGVYINVNFATRFAANKDPVRELVSFHLDDDKTWRVTGYTLH